MSAGVSGIKSGSIVANDVTACANGVCIYHLVEGNWVSQSGDSGSPILNSAGTSIFGELSGGTSSDSFWSPEDRIAADLGVTIITG